MRRYFRENAGDVCNLLYHEIFGPFHPFCFIVQYRNPLKTKCCCELNVTEFLIPYRGSNFNHKVLTNTHSNPTYFKSVKLVADNLKLK